MHGERNDIDRAAVTDSAILIAIFMNVPPVFHKQEVLTVRAGETGRFFGRPVWLVQFQSHRPTISAA